MTIVSNSDIETAQKCERMFYYSRIMDGGYKPRTLPVAIKRGSFGHKMMEVGFEVLLAGGTLDEANTAVEKVLEELLQSGDPDAVEMMGVYRHVIAFLSYSLSDKCVWRPVALEDSRIWNITENKEHIRGLSMLEGHERLFAFTPDLIVQFTQGVYKGQYAVLDYKFLGQYMKERALVMAQQIPKYLIYRNKTNPEQRIRRGAFVQLNTRAQPGDSGHKLFLIKWLEPTKVGLATVERENEVMVHKVAEMYENTEPDNYIRTVNKDACNWCFFADTICPMERDGKNISKVLKTDFLPNDYGYSPDLPEDF